MNYLVSRRKISANGKTFTAQPGNESCFLRVTSIGQTASPGHRIAPGVWAREVLQHSQNGHVLLVVHGFRIQQHSFLREVADVRRMLGSQFRGAVVGLDWPTNGRLFDYRKDRRDAQKTAAPLLRDAVNALHTARPTVKLHILAHSMGCFFTSVALQASLGTPLEGKLRGSLRTIAATGADVDQDWSKAGQPFVKALERTCRRFMVHFSGHDEILHVSEDRYNNRKKRLGRDGPASPQPSILIGVPWTDYYRQNHWGLFNLRHSHNFYYDDPVFYRTLARSLQ